MTTLAKVTSAVIALAFLALPWCLLCQAKRKPAPPYDREGVERSYEKARDTHVVAVQLETKVATARKETKAKMEAADKAVETRINAGISITDIPMPVAAEYAAMLELIAAQAHQLELEKQRGDAWQAAAIASQEAADAARNQLDAVARAERRKGLKWGLGIGGAILIVAVLI